MGVDWVAESVINIISMLPLPVVSDPRRCPISSGRTSRFGGSPPCHRTTFPRWHHIRTTQQNNLQGIQPDLGGGGQSTRGVAWIILVLKLYVASCSSLESHKYIQTAKISAPKSSAASCCSGKRQSPYHPI